MPLIHSPAAKTKQLWRRKMLNGKKILIAVLLIISGSALYAQKDIFNIAIIDPNRIYEYYFAESKSIRDLEDFRSTIQAEIIMYTAEIDELKIRKLDAQKSKNESLVLNMEELIHEREQFLRDFKSIRSKQYNDRIATLKDYDFQIELLEAIEFIAIRDGFSLVLDRRTIAPLYIAPEVDITERVLEYLFARIGKDYTPP